ncbi:DUF2017 family protein [Trueperella sp. LYQ143]|uniref:DUF2017 family protein n=1 Tax=unclassified Trueperella TaxID=2630174 RepID=UPI003983C04F
MMAFHREHNGIYAAVDEGERRALAGMARDVVVLLGSDVEHECERRSQQIDPDDPFAEFEADLADIADSIADESDGLALPRLVPVDDAVARLLPDMSEDPDEAQQLRELTEDTVAAAKIENLVTFYLGLMAIPEGESRFRISYEDGPAWLAALNDIRLVLATRLQIDSEQEAEEIYQRASVFMSPHPQVAEDFPEVTSSDDMLAVLYAMTTWWQDSLLRALNRKRPRG